MTAHHHQRLDKAKPMNEIALDPSTIIAMVDQLVRFSERRRDDVAVSRFMTETHPVTAMESFQTVCIDPGRGAGKTTAIAAMLGARPYDVAILGVDLNVSRHVFGGMPRGCVINASHIHRDWQIARDHARNAPEGYRPRVYVDEPFMVHKRLRYRTELFVLIDTFGLARNGGTVVMLGRQ